MDVVDVTPIGPQPLKDTAVRSACDKTLKPEVRSLPNCSKLGKPESHNDLPLRLPRSLRLERDVLFIGTRFSNLYTAVHECVTVIMMSRLVHTGLGSSSLVAHVLHYPHAPTRTAL